MKKVLITPNEIDVYKRIPLEQRHIWHLFIDAVYRANPKAKNFSGEVLSKLLPVGTQGGFRFVGASTEPKLIALFTSGDDIYWRDDFNSALGILLYYGDQKQPGKGLTQTKFKGNYILERIFEWSCSEDPSIRKKIPPIFVS